MTLSETLLDPARRPATVDALVAVVESEVKSKGGLSGTALRTAVSAAQAIDKTIVRRAVARMLPEFLAQLDPFWESKGEASFGPRLVAEGDRAAEALLEVTDRRAANPKHAAIAKVYGMIRSKAKGHVVAALPAVGTALESVAR